MWHFGHTHFYIDLQLFHDIIKKFSAIKSKKKKTVLKNPGLASQVPWTLLEFLIGWFFEYLLVSFPIIEVKNVAVSYEIQKIYWWEGDMENKN